MVGPSSLLPAALIAPLSGTPLPRAFRTSQGVAPRGNARPGVARSPGTKLLTPRAPAPLRPSSRPSSADPRRNPLARPPQGSMASAGANELDADDPTLLYVRIPIGAGREAQGPGTAGSPGVVSELLVSRSHGAAREGESGRVHVLVVPGNPGIVTFYADFLRHLRRALGPSVGLIVCLCHAGHTDDSALSRPPAPFASDAGAGAGASRVHPAAQGIQAGKAPVQLFSLEQQVQHKLAFLCAPWRYLDAAVPDCASLRDPGDASSGEGRGPGAGAGAGAGGGCEERWVLIGHSIGAHICVELQKRMRREGAGTEMVHLPAGAAADPGLLYPVIGLYPFLRANRDSRQQMLLAWLAHRTLLCVVVAQAVQLLGWLLPRKAVRRALHWSIGRQWTPSAVAATQQYLLRYAVLRNFSYMGMTEFDHFSRTPLDWAWLSANPSACTFVFGRDDHWGPLSMLKELQARIPAMNVLLDEEGHPHTFCCTAQGSLSIARLCARLCAPVLAAPLAPRL